jgi:hypothetical protein
MLKFQQAANASHGRNRVSRSGFRMSERAPRAGLLSCGGSGMVPWMRMSVKPMRLAAARMANAASSFPDAGIMSMRKPEGRSTTTEARAIRLSRLPQKVQ